MKPKLLLCLITTLWAGYGFADVSLPEIFSDNMVLQQQSEITLWGWGKPRERILISAGWLDRVDTVVVGNQSTWETTLKTPAAGGPYTLTLKGHNEIRLENVMIGEVWICSGQSNMEWSARSGIHHAEEEISRAWDPLIRFFTVGHRVAHAPQIDLEGNGGWVECRPGTMAGFSAIGYFFARKLRKELDVPVGLINSSWGGTPAEAWMSERLIVQDSMLKKAADELKPVPWGPVEPGRIYHAMIAPLTKFRIAGALWYQGEGNVANAWAYHEMFSRLITGWREDWGYEFPFYFAQIAPFRYGRPMGGAEIREAQRRTLALPSTGMVVTSDIGDTTDIHPKNKQDVGLRMANIALTDHYKVSETEAHGPLFRDVEVRQNKVYVRFDHADGLHAKGNAVDMFELAGNDGEFYPAIAEIDGEGIVLQSAKVKKPVEVRFAWRNTATPGLFNAAGLPASCFLSE